MSKVPESTKRLMGALVRVKPKPHEEIQLGKSKARKKKVAKKAEK